MNRKLLVSVFNSQEAREAVLGGGRIIDSEDPRSALGNIKPRQIMDIRDAVLNYSLNLDVQLSTNIGEDQLLFDRSESGLAIEKSPYEIAGKAAQSAIGVATAMGTSVHPCNLIKVGVDGMQIEKLSQVLNEVVLTLNRTEHYSNSQVMSVLFVQDIAKWKNRKKEKFVIENMVELREFHPTNKGDDEGFDIKDYAVNTLKDENDRVIFTQSSQVSLGSLVRNGIIPEGSNHSIVKLNDLFPHSTYFPSISGIENRTSKDVIKAMVDASADAGVDSIMLDTRIQSKVSRISLCDTSSDGLIDLNIFDTKNSVERTGVLSLEEMRFFVDYCHFRNIEANLAGSLQSYHAQQLWVLIPNLDQLSTRGGSTAVSLNPYTNSSAANNRHTRVTDKNLVKGLIPPEQGGVLNLPEKFISTKKGKKACDEVISMIKEERQKQGLPELKTFIIDSYGNQKKY